MERRKRNNASKAIKLQHSRPTIGLITPLYYDTPLWLGVVDEAKKRDINLFWFLSGHTHTNKTDATYGLVNIEKIDGLITWLGAGVSETIDYDQKKIKAFFKRFAPLPIVNYEGIIDGFPCIVTDTYSSMRELITHLIEVHGCRRIALIRGPKGHVETEERVRAYIDTLAKFGLPIDPNLIMPPADDFGSNIIPKISGRKVMNLLLDERKLRPKIDFDSVVVTEWEEALGAIMELQARDIQVPYDIAVVGFNDSLETKVFTPSLTTVRKPFYESGQTAVDLLLKLLNGEEIPAIVNLSGELVIRRSCGCLDPLIIQSFPPLTASKDKSDAYESKIPLRSSAPAQKEQIFCEVCKVLNALPSMILCQSVKQLIEAFCADMEDGSQGAFLPVLDNILNSAMIKNEDLSSWRSVISTLYNYLLPSIDNQKLAAAKSLWQQAGVIIDEKEWRLQTYRNLQVDQQIRLLRNISKSLLTAFNLKKLMKIVEQDLPQLDIISSYISLYEERSMESGISKLILAYNEKGRIDAENEDLYFPSKQLVPDGLLPNDRRYTMVVMPLIFQEEELGSALFEMGPGDGYIYRVIQRELSTALKGAMLLEEREKAEEALKEKAQELARSNAELEQFAYMASHDLQEPLRKVLFFSNELKFCRLQENGADYIEQIEKAVRRMQSMISDMLTLSKISTQANPFVTVNLNQTVNEALSDLEIRMKNINGKVEIGDLPTIDMDPAQIRQLFVNLIGNALKFHKPGVPPIIKISAKVITLNNSPHKLKNAPEETKSPDNSDQGFGARWCRIFVEDNGIGFEEEFAERIFQPFQRLHSREEFEGHGIGLTICQKIVERHHGQIAVKSSPGVGATFIITLPLRQLSADPSKARKTKKLRTVMLVDDDSLDRSAVKSLVNWEKYGFIIGFEASNGRQALQTLLEHPEINIIITDINMPVMNGLEFIAEVRKTNFFPGIVVLSAYNDYGIVRQAFKLGVTDYILKTEMNPENVIRTLSAVAERLERDKLIYQDQTAPRSPGQKYLKERFLKEVLELNAPEFSEKLFDELQVKLSKGNLVISFLWVDDYQVVCNRYDNNTLKSFIGTVQNAIEQGLAGENKAEVVALSPQEYVILTSDNNNSQYKIREKVLGILGQVKYELSDRLNINVSIGVSSIKSGFEKIPELYKEAETNARLRFIYGKGRIIFPEDAERIGEPFETRIIGQEEDLLFALREVDEARATRELRKLLTMIGMVKTTTIKKIIPYYMELIFILTSFLNEKGEDLAKIFGKEEDFYEKIIHFETQTELNAWIESIVINIVNYFRKKKDVKVNRAIAKAQEFIKNNYNQDLTLKTVSDYIGLCESHFSTLFAKSTGESFVDYLTRIRIEKAMELMETTNLKIYEIAASVGYVSTSYFSTVFKKITGINPNNYKRT